MCFHRDIKCNCLITWQITPEGRYVKPCNKAIAFYIAMKTQKSALNPYNCTRCSLKSLFENDRDEKILRTNTTVNQS